ncbi:MAG: hypothetical protein ABEJ31_01940 [Haloarculaceae archaeon]
MQRQITGGALAVAGLAVSAGQVALALSATPSAVGRVVAGGPFVLMALAVAFVGGWLASGADGLERPTLVVGWAVVGAVVAASTAALVTFAANVSVPRTPAWAVGPTVGVDAATAGLLGGSLIGIYDAQRRARLAALERERDRTERFANRAADLNNYGRALNETESLPEVSALCVEAGETLVDLRGSAFVTYRDGAATVVDGTIAGVDADAIAALADRAADQEPATVAVHTADLPDALGADVASVATIPVARGPDHPTAVIVALGRGEEPLPPETRSLLELLVSHAGTALATASRRADPVGERADATPDWDREA